MLEYNADTPTALLEAAVAQWDWLKDVDERGDQFNSIHERLIEAWKALRERDGGPIHFAAMTNVDSPEDYITVEYLRDTAIQAGFKTAYLDVERHRLGPRPQRVRGQHRLPDPPVFKLYPWEWMFREEFGPHVRKSPTQVGRAGVEDDPQLQDHPAAAVRAAPGQPVPAAGVVRPAAAGSYVRKPVHAREGANIQVVIDGQARARDRRAVPERAVRLPGAAPR